MKTYNVPINKLSLDEFVRICQSESRLRLTKHAEGLINQGAAAVQILLRKKTAIYGVNTGIGDLCDVVLSEKALGGLQKNIILSHACGSAPYLDESVSRGALFLTINSLSKGFSGVTLKAVQKLISLFNAGVSPLLPAQGSLGASGDLIPLAHLGLMLLGQGKVYERGKVVSAAGVLRRLRIEQHKFQPKEALAIINGTEVTTSQAAFNVNHAQNLVHIATRATAALFEVLGASRKTLDNNIHTLKPHTGQKITARLIREFLKGSKLCDRPHKKIQDSYIIRCAPQIDGAILEHVEHARGIVETEINAVTDNPLFFVKKGNVKALSGGNFHAQNLAFALDSLSIALATLGKVTERRIERLLNASLSGLPPFLANNSGLNSGLMIAQYLAAALVAENAVLAHPASIQSTPVSANQEDFVSMAMTSANKSAQILRNCERILAVEILALTQAMEMSAKIHGYKHAAFSPSARKLYKETRSYIPSLEKDRWISKDIDMLTNLIRIKRFSSL